MLQHVFAFFETLPSDVGYMVATNELYGHDRCIEIHIQLYYMYNEISVVKF
jgi:hypothetical protein